MHAGRHEEITGAFGGADGEHGCFDFPEMLGIKEIADCHGEFMAQFKVFLQFGSSEIEVTIFQADHFIAIHTVFNEERRRFGGIQDLYFGNIDLDFARGHVGVFLTFGTKADFTGGGKDIFGTDAFGNGEIIAGNGGVKNQLYKTAAVSEVNKDHAAVVASSLNPTANGYGLSDMLFAECSAVMCSFHF